MSESKPILATDVIQKDIFDNATKSAEKFEDSLKGATDALIALNAETAKQLKNTTLPGQTTGVSGPSAADLKKQNALLAESQKQRKLIAAADKLREDQAKKTAKAISDQQKADEKASKSKIKADQDEAKAKQKAADDNAKAIKKQADAEAKAAKDKAKADADAIKANEAKIKSDEKAAKALENQNNAYVQASKHLEVIRKEYLGLVIAGKGAEQATKDLGEEVNKLDKELKEADASAGVFRREVGNYREEVTDAIKDSGLFGAALGRLDESSKQAIEGFAGITEQLKGLKKGEEAAEAGANKLGKTLKAIGIAALVAAIASLFAFFTSSREGALQFDLVLNKIKATLGVLLGSFAAVGRGLVGLGSAFVSFFKGDFSDASDTASKAVDDIKNAFDGNLDAIEKQIEGYDELTKAIFEFEDELAVLNIALKKVQLAEEDLNVTANDNTISLGKQREALAKAIELRKAGANISKVIADKEFELSSMALELELRKNKVSEADIELLKKEGFQNINTSKLSIKASSEAIEAVNQKYLATLEANNKIQDLRLEDEKTQREIAQADTIRNIEAIRSKRFAADAEVTILTNQIADERKQLEDRQKFNDQLLEKNTAGTDQEIALFEKFGVTREQVYDLINTGDKVELANKIEKLRIDTLSEEQTVELEKIVKTAQLNTITYNDNVKKQELERIDREKKILELNQQIATIKDQGKLQAVENVSNTTAQQAELANEMVLQGQNVFNQKMIANAQYLANQRIALLEEETKIKKKILDDQYKADQQHIKDTVYDQQTQDKELEKLNATYNNNVAAADADAINKQKALQLSITEQQRKQLIAQTEFAVQKLNETTQALSNELDRRNAIQAQQSQFQLTKTEQNITKQQDLAERGLANTLAYEQEQQAKQQLAQQDALKKQAKQKQEIALAEAYLNAYNTELKQPLANPLTAASKALADVLIAQGISKTIVQFAADGNDDVQGAGTTTSDSIPFMLSKHEGVVKAEANIKNKGVVASLNAGMFDQLYEPKYDLNKYRGDTGLNIMNSILLQSNAKVEKLLLEVREEIKNKPVQLIDVDKLGNLVETRIEKQVKTITTHKSRSRI